MSVASLVVGVLGVWRITHLLAVEDGPGEAIARLRAAARAGPAAGLLDCFQCTSVWAAAPFALALESGWANRLALWAALSGAAILLERIAERAGSSPTALYFEHPPATPRGGNDVLPG